MVTVGVTGGIGSGKSTVCQFWSDLGAYVLNADDLAKELMVSDPEIKKQLVDTFGEDSFFDDGSLNRKYLAQEAFERDRVAELNAIVHPKIPGAAAEKISQADDEGYEVFVYEAALLLENLDPGDLDYMVLVLADEEHRLERVKERDNSSIKDIRERMNKQRNFEEATERVDYVIRNNGTIEELKKKAELVYENFLPFSGKNEKYSH